MFLVIGLVLVNSIVVVVEKRVLTVDCFVVDEGVVVRILSVVPGSVVLESVDVVEKEETDTLGMAFIETGELLLLVEGLEVVLIFVIIGLSVVSDVKVEEIVEEVVGKVIVEVIEVDRAEVCLGVLGIGMIMGVERNMVGLIIAAVVVVGSVSSLVAEAGVLLVLLK